jgi:hypothetical protein
MKYVIDLWNQNETGMSDTPSSMTNGKYGFVVNADNIETAKEQVITRAKKDDFYNKGWSAQICPLSSSGQRKGGCFDRGEQSITINLKVGEKDVKEGKNKKEE